MYSKGRHGLLSQETMDHVSGQTDLVRHNWGVIGKSF